MRSHTARSSLYLLTGTLGVEWHRLVEYKPVLMSPENDDTAGVPLHILISSGTYDLGSLEGFQIKYGQGGHIRT